MKKIRIQGSGRTIEFHKDLRRTGTRAVKTIITFSRRGLILVKQNYVMIN